MKKKITHEVKVGAIALLTVIAFILMYEFLKGTALFTRTNSYHIIYDDIAGLTESNPVEINGYQAGVVQSIRLINDGSGRLYVSLSVDRKINIPKDSRAEITTASLIAGMKVILRMGHGSAMCHNHDTIGGYVATSIIDRVGDAFTPLESNFTGIVVRLDSLIGSLNALFTTQMSDDIRSAVSDASVTLSGLKEVTEGRKEELKSIISELQAFTAILSTSGPSLDTTLQKLAVISDAVAESDPGASLASLRSSLEGLDTIVKGLSHGEGSAGKLITEDSLYNNLNSTLESLDLLIRDLTNNPKKYVHFSLFGKKGE